MRVHTIPFSTNADRVALAAAHKGVEVEWVYHDPADRSAIETLSGQPLVPVAEWEDGAVLHDSMPIVARLEALVPDPPLWPADPARRRAVDALVGWFDHVWKVPPNAIDAELDRDAPDEGRIAAWSEQLAAWTPGLEALLGEGPYLAGGELTAADVAVQPFLRFLCPPDPRDDHRFHRILHDAMGRHGPFPRLEAWLDRVGPLPYDPGGPSASA